MARPALPRTSSSGSGFFFCGIMLLPVADESASSKNPNSSPVIRMKSSAMREGAPSTATPRAGTSRRSRDRTRRPCCWRRRGEAERVGEERGVDRVAGAGDRAGSERQRVGLLARRLEPRRDRGAAPPRGSAGSARPARASRGACACTTASTRRRPALPDRQTRRWSRGASPASSGMRRRRYNRRSTETCSLRDRPVCRRRPASPIRATSWRSTKLVHVFVVAGDPRRIARGPARGSPAGLGDRLGIGGVEHAGARQRFRPGQAAGHIVFEEPAIERERHAEIKRRRIGRRVKPSRP